ncbi:MAG: VIT1/CCC1 transporter family protein [Candidatus Aenigmatarchaeota archaeon]
MNHPMKIGLSFGLTSGIITTLGLIVGLHSSTHSSLIIIGGIITIAVADAFSDAMGIHISEEAENKHTHSEVWQATFATFLSKFVVALTFIAPALLLELSTAILVSIAWGLLLLGIFSYIIANEQKENPWKVVGEHIIIALIVIVITHFVGDWVSVMFG